MKKLTYPLFLGLALASTQQPGRTQTTPANDGTGTVVETLSPTQTNITGGSLSGDGRNLFQSFEEFNVPANTTTNFISAPGIDNIVNRVTGGNFSLIEGTINVLGGNSNLFLINPAGIFFNGATINVPGNFFATTANGLFFQGGLLDVSDPSPDFAQIVGDPLEFQFDADADGFIAGSAIVNAENAGLATSAFVGSVDANSGLGQLDIAAVPGTSRVRISPPGALLSLEVEAADLAGGVTPTRLPELLTGGGYGSPFLEPGPEPNTAIVAITSESNSLGDNSNRIVSTLSGSVAITSLDGSFESVRLESFQSDIDFQGVPAGDRIPSIFITETFGDENGLTIDSLEIRALGATDLIEIASFNFLGQDFSATTAGGPIRIVSTLEIANDLAAGGGVSIDSVSAFGPTAAGTASFATNGGDLIISSEVGAEQGFTTSENVGLFGIALDINTGGGDLVFETQGLFAGDTSFARNEILVDFSEDFAVAPGQPALSIAAANVVQRFPAGGTSQGGVIRVIGAPGLASTIELSGNLGDPLNIETFSNVNLDLDGAFEIAAAGVFLESLELTPLDGSTVAATGPERTLTATGPGGIFVRDLFDFGAANDAQLNLVSTNPEGNLFIGGGFLTGAIALQSQGGATIAGIPSSDNLSPTSGSLFADSISISTGASSEQPFNSQILESPAFGNPSQLASLLLDSNGLEINGSTGQIFTPTDALPPGQFVFDAAFGTISLVGAGPAAPDPPVVPPTPPDLPIVVPDPPIVPPDLPIVADPPVDGGDVVTPPPDILQGIDGVQLASDLNNELQENEGSIRAALSEASDDGSETTARIASLAQVQEDFLVAARETGVETAAIYYGFRPKRIFARASESFTRQETQQTKDFENYLRLEPSGPPSLEILPEASDVLEILMVASTGEPVALTVDVSRAELLELAASFAREASDPLSQRYLSLGQELYDRLIRPVEAELERRGIESLVFVLPEGLRLIPMAALHDGEGFLVETYLPSLAPSMSLTDRNYRSYKNLSLLVGGTQEFADERSLGPLPAARLEVELLQKLWPGEARALADAEFEFDRLRRARRKDPTGIVHLATHADFTPGNIEQTYLQFFSSRLSFDEFGALNFANPIVELLVLSACRTAFGDIENELGFAGSAVASGSKSVIATLWFVQDQAALALQAELYSQLPEARTKAEALALAQRALIAGDVVFDREGGRLVLADFAVDLPEDFPVPLERLDHPALWAAHVLVGNPW